MSDGSGRPADAGDAAVTGLRAIADGLDATLGPALLDQPDGVHAHRKAVRRLRSALAAYRPFFDDDAVHRLHVAYREWGRELGAARDLEVRIAAAERFLAADGTAPATGRLLAGLRDDYRVSHRQVVRRGVTVAAAERRAELTAFLDAPPLTDKARRRTKRGVRRRLVKEGDRVLRRADSAAANPDDVAALHEVRKSARRLRYAVEAVTRPPVALFGAKAKALADAAERIHDLLGDQRDALAFADHVEGRAGVADDAVARARAEAAERRADLPAAVDDLRAALDRFR
ncbi:CHAD domain-containing protein [Mumia sp. DW29H23]|uniref:CHAD domain-containing protein n=1 Tax=Mumia sp. DW29H23 TaxID=3421241 RepID=UPI003D6995DD